MALRIRYQDQGLYPCHIPCGVVGVDGVVEDGVPGGVVVVGVDTEVVVTASEYQNHTSNIIEDS